MTRVGVHRRVLCHCVADAALSAKLLLSARKPRLWMSRQEVEPPHEGRCRAESSPSRLLASEAFLRRKRTGSRPRELGEPVVLRGHSAAERWLPPLGRRDGLRFGLGLNVLTP
jgi:hypothetical protein